MTLPQLGATTLMTLEAKTKTVGIDNRKIAQAVISIGDRPFYGQTELLRQRPNRIDIIGKNPEVHARGSGYRRKVRPMIQEQSPVRPPQRSAAKPPSRRSSEKPSAVLVATGRFSTSLGRSGRRSSQSY